MPTIEINSENFESHLKEYHRPYLRHALSDVDTSVSIGIHLTVLNAAPSEHYHYRERFSSSELKNDAMLAESLVQALSTDPIRIISAIRFYKIRTLKCVACFIAEKIETFPHEKLREFLPKSVHGTNLIKFAVTYSLIEPLRRILVHITRNREIMTDETLKNIFLSGNSNLMLDGDAKTGRVLLEFMKNNITRFSQETIQQLFLQRTTKSFLRLLGECIFSWPEGPYFYIPYLPSYTAGKNVLMLTIGYAPKEVTGILKFISEYKEWITESVIQKIFLDSNDEGDNVLMLACGPERWMALTSILNFIKEEKLHPKAMGQIFRQKNHRGEDLFAIAQNSISKPSISEEVKDGLNKVLSFAEQYKTDIEPAAGTGYIQSLTGEVMGYMRSRYMTSLFFSSSRQELDATRVERMEERRAYSPI